MVGANEVEIKFQVKDISALTEQLRNLGFQQVTPRTHEMNVLFDLPGHRLRSRGELLRIRKYGDAWVLTHKAKSKGQSGPHKTRIETETRIADGAKMEGILRALQFEPSFRYEKFRAEWQRTEGHVVIDETPIGNFAEIEGPPEWIDSVAHELGLRRADYITENYSALFANWKKKTGSKAGDMTFESVSSSVS